MPSIDDVRLKESGDLTEEEIKILQDNADDLTEEERESFKDVLEKGKKGGEGDDDKKFSFESKEEFEKAVAEQVEATRQARIDAKKKKQQKKDKGEDDDSFFDESYKPRGWEGFAQDFFKKIGPRLAPEIAKHLQEMNVKKREKFNKELNRINKEFEKEIETLRESGEPIPKKGTKERKAFNKELAAVGVKYKGVTNMTQAYEIFKALKGRGEEGEGEEEEGGEEDETKLSDSQKKIASKIGGGSRGKGGSKKRLYKDIATRDMDEAFEVAKRKLTSK